jgi:hypothetical protein
MYGSYAGTVAIDMTGRGGGGQASGRRGQAGPAHPERVRGSAGRPPLGVSGQNVPVQVAMLFRDQDVLDRLVGALAGRQALLVLDNCEHLIAAAADLASRVLARCPGMRVLATSREPLNITGEAVWPVGPLAASPAELLFAERAAAVAPCFALTAENAPAVSRVCWTGCRWPSSWPPRGPGP